MRERESLGLGLATRVRLLMKCQTWEDRPQLRQTVRLRRDWRSKSLLIHGNYITIKSIPASVDIYISLKSARISIRSITPPHTRLDLSGRRAISLCKQTKLPEKDWFQSMANTYNSKNNRRPGPGVFNYGWIGQISFWECFLVVKVRGKFLSKSNGIRSTKVTSIETCHASLFQLGNAIRPRAGEWVSGQLSPLDHYKSAITFSFRASLSRVAIPRWPLAICILWCFRPVVIKWSSLSLRHDLTFDLHFYWPNQACRD